MAETCSVVRDVDCLSPANMSPIVAVRARCFACGEAVCVNCSRRRRWYRFGRRRICWTCIEDAERRS